MSRGIVTFLLALAVLTGGIAAEWYALSSSEVMAEITPVEDPIAPLEERSIRLPAVGESIEIDITDSIDVLHSLPEEERAHQIADWAVFSVLAHAGVGSTGVRDATWDVPPIRLPEMVEAYSYNYRSARHVARPDGVVWLFRRADDPSSAAALGREADQATMELGARPERFLEFTYDSSIRDGTLTITLRSEIAAERLFGPEYGYVERPVSDVEELDAALSAIDSVASIRREGERLVIGGRRFSRHRTPGVQLDDVAALYQAHLVLQDAGAELDAALNSVTRDSRGRFNALVDEYNRGVRGSLFGRFEPTRSTLGERVASMAREYGIDVNGRQSAELLEALLPAVQARAESQEREYAATHPVAPSEPGFSLDPQWDLDELRRDLQLVLRSPEGFFLSARADASSTLPNDRSTARIEIARELTSGLSRGDFAWLRLSRAYGLRIGLLSADEQARVREILRLIEDPSSRELGYLEIDQAIDEGRRDDAGLLPGLLALMRARDQVQCARYDGPLQGTAVGMTLYYTDLLAKLWQAVDYGHTAPVDDVPGFLSWPRIGPDVEPEWHEEIQRLPSTRLWFAPDEASFAQDADGSIFIAPIAARVYSAGSNPINPGTESEPAEPSRRSLGWWDRHFAEVADHEPEYHRQNEILKWSVITGWLAERREEVGLGRLASALERVDVDHSLRFDRWYEANRSRLRYSGDLPLLPPSEWVGDTECLELLASYTFSQAGTDHWRVTGGVSLGSMRSLGSRSLAREAWTSLPRAVRRGAIRLGTSTPIEAGRFTTATSEVALSAERGVARTTLRAFSPSVRFRHGATHFARSDIDVLATSVRAGGGSAEIALGTRHGPAALARATVVADGAGEASLSVRFGDLARRARGGNVGGTTVGPASDVLRSYAAGGAEALSATGGQVADGPLARVLGALRRGDGARATQELGHVSSVPAAVEGPNLRAISALTSGADATPLAAGHRVLAVAPVRATNGVVPPATAVRAARRGEAVIYVEDRALAGALDWELSPTAALGQASRRGTVVIEEVSVDSLGAARATAALPDALRTASGATFIRVGPIMPARALLVRCEDGEGNATDCR